MQRRQGPAFYSGGYGNRRRDPYRDQMLLRILLSLANQIMMMEHKPPLTILLTAINVLVFLKPQGLSAFVPSTRAGCLQPAAMLYGGQMLPRLFSAPFLHGDEMHLYYNMASLLWKGSILEPSLGSIKFGLLILELLISSGLLYVTAATLASIMNLTLGPFNSCAVGFSAVLFGLKVIVNARSSGWTSVAGISVPTKHVAWAELLLIQLITPEASFLGHLCGILAGLLHLYVTSKIMNRIQRHWRRERGRRHQNYHYSAAGAGGAPRRPYAARTWGHGTWGS